MMPVLPMRLHRRWILLGALVLIATAGPKARGTTAGDPPAVEWAVVEGRGEYDDALDVATGRDGAVYISGQTDDAYFISAYNADGTFRWSNAGDMGYAAGVAAAPDRGAFAAGGSVLDGDSQAFLARYWPNGNKRWVVFLSAPLGSAARDVAVGGRHVYVVGDTGGPSISSRTVRGDSDVFVASYALNGRLEWLRLIHGGDGYDSGQAIAVTRDAVYVSGFSGDGDALLARLSVDGRREWLRRLAGRNVNGGPSLDSARGVAADERSVFVGGGTDATGTFAGTPIAGSRNAFVARFSPAGVRQWVHMIGGPGDEGLAGVAVAGQRVYATGIARGPAFENVPVRSEADLYLAELARDDGALESVTTLTGDPCPHPGYTYGHGIATDGKGGIYVSGDSLCKHFEEQPICSGTDAILVKFAHTRTGSRALGRAAGSDPCEPDH